MLVWDIKHQFVRWAHAHRWGDGVTENSILERLAIRLQQADDRRAVMAATKRDDIVGAFQSAAITLTFLAIRERMNL
jgi:hypothetical protein